MSLRDELTDFKANGMKIEKDTISMTKDQRINAKAILLNEYLGHFKGYISSNKVNARYTVLWFWEPDCSHCKEETPKFHKLYQEKLKAKGVEVVTIYLNKDIDDWNKFVDHIKHYYDFTIQNKLTDWINGLNPFDPFRDKYDISSTPVLYLLDKNKKIIAKRIGYDQVLEIIENIDKDEVEMNKK
jgi:thiol-disulfide isomerase/thioredoxin